MTPHIIKMQLSSFYELSFVRPILNADCSVLIFAKNLEMVSTFYKEVLQWQVITQDTEHVELINQNFSLIIHKIPSVIAETILIAEPPNRRENSVYKLCFSSKNIFDARKRAEQYGGAIDTKCPPWFPSNAAVFNGHDPEGNVFQIRKIN